MSMPKRVSVWRVVSGADASNQWQQGQLQQQQQGQAEQQQQGHQPGWCAL
jgi:hypothetical protein